MSFKEEMDKRLRRICGVTDDSLVVVMNTATETITEWAGYSCEYTDTNSWTVVKVIKTLHEPTRWTETVAEKKFSDLGELMRALDEVEL